MQSSRRKFLRNTIAGAAALSISPLMQSCMQSPVKLTILHTNDVHSHIDPFPANDARWANKGGFARRAQLINQIRTDQEHVLLFDCGDIFQGTPYFNIYKGKLEIELMNKMGYDAATIGNHEFDNGIEALANNIQRAKFPFVCTNYDVSDSVLSDLTVPYKVIQKGPLKVGVIGLGIELAGLVNPKSYKETRYNDPIEAANITALVLREKLGCDLIIALSHLGYKYKSDKVSDVLLATNSQHIDIILGGHTHTFMEAPDKVQNLNGKEVIVNQAGWGGIYLGHLDLELTLQNKKSVALVNSICHV
ncbi:metallophosphatase [Carboxylicivirga sediminis]|uniref:Metallophosphatase n=1 Tax=Carboxylicivirga sediminis TaxID=2006564 RepID=A0A941IYD5_9BACT|nr:metallophosphatase [Carboxylicivirga sediminis]MBR8537766.1 metallophosphatase [Carboxylicivirga sediminis]